MCGKGQKDRVHTKDNAVQYPFTKSCVCSKMIFEETSQFLENSQLPSDHATPLANQWRSQKIMDLSASFQGIKLTKQWMSDVSQNGWRRIQVDDLMTEKKCTQIIWGLLLVGDDVWSGATRRFAGGTTARDCAEAWGPWQGRGGWEGPMAWYTLLKLRSREVVARWIWPYHWLITMQIYHPHQSNRSFWISASSSSYRNVP